ncbi:glycoside hydrolase family 127 protein [Mucilaginibacter ginsenosidivorans]|uniref:Glycoside hydrolase family 127 protein n=1 Tax=Mucilaginibacter ginsenosidivorans TaxID=398053 RepID=A0A5B8UVW5_9SPHI|nr:glycoside hydrolase family 127 protein [Mucilaginibacter ginsenosidivorans]QEC63267.1 glycoside hydrolase family 127 protein [Mucilaginibacter ginsenosidivorans]
MRNQTKSMLLLCGALACGHQLFAQQRDYPIQPVPFTHVHVNDNFWEPKMEVNASVTIPYVLAQCRAHGRVDNFLRAAKLESGDKLSDFPFDDTDIYKVIEGASYAMQVKKNPALERSIDTLIGIIGAAQEKDGYLYTFRTVNAKKPHEWIGSKRWENVEVLSHELYDAGHLYEAAVAHYQATGKRTLLNIALKNADLLVATFGYGKEEKYPGHQIVEIGLAKLYRVTGDKKYLDLAKFFLDIRGPKGDAYNQADKKVIDQHQAEGHAVRAGYMYTGMADVAALTGNEQYLHAIDDIWNDVVFKKLYITGGIGATNAGEAFGEPYQLPNMSAYAETCAAIANVYWNSRMFLLHGDSKYIDVLERTLYNGLLSGVSLSGDRFFYPNPLASMNQHQRSAWFSCACCISNMTRFLPSVPGYVYAKDKNNLYLNLYMSNASDITLAGDRLSLIETTDYPWNGNIDVIVNPEKKFDFTLRLRIPGWAQDKPIAGDLYTFDNKQLSPVVISINGKPIKYTTEKGYAVLERKWKKGDRITMNLPMPTQKVMANAQVKDDRDRFAFERGPIVYCLEGPDNKDSLVQNITIDKSAIVNAAFKPDMLNGVEVITTEGKSTRRQLNTDVLLETNQKVTAIPYYAWANRGPSEMTVWIPYEASAARPQPAPTIASTSKVTASVKNTRMWKALNDQYDPEDSKDASAPYLHWWPKQNTTEFVQYDFDREHTVSESKVYWFDDGPWGGCRIPASYKVYYKKGDEWIPVKNTIPYEIAKDKYNVLTFEPVTTTALKLEVQLPADNSAGIHEWAVK